MKINNNSTLLIGGLIVIILGVIYFFFSYNDFGHNEVKQPISMGRDMNSERKQQVIQILEEEMKKNGGNTPENKLKYDIEKYQTLDKHWKYATLKEYARSYRDNNLNKKSTSTQYQKDITIYGLVSLLTYASYSDLFMEEYDNANYKVVKDKSLEVRQLANMTRLSDIANEVKSPEIMNDKVFVANRLLLNSNILINFSDIPNSNKYVTRVKEDLERMDKVNYSLFDKRNSKYGVGPYLSETAAYVALVRSGDVERVSDIDTPHQNLSALNNEDKTSVNRTLVSIDMYRLYYYSVIAPASLDNKNAIINTIVDDMVSRANYSEDTLNHVKSIMGNTENTWNDVVANINTLAKGKTTLYKLLNGLGI